MASVGAASFFSDADHEIATAVLPSFLTGVLRGLAATLGLMLAGALLCWLRLRSGSLLAPILDLGRSAASVSL